MVVAQFDLRKVGQQNYNRYAYAKLAVSGGALLNTSVVATNAGSYTDSAVQGNSQTQYTLIGYDYASNTSTRSYYIQVKRGHSSDNLEIRNAAIWAIEFTV